MIKTAWKHFKTICTHKKWVAHYCNMCGLYWQGFTHDLSKFSRVEFNESVKYYTGDRSPIDNCKAAIGYSEAWMHHKSHNRHHYEYWTDNYDKGTTCIKMPYKYALEMVCDYLAAGRAYGKDKFSMESELNWWKEKRKIAKMHPDTKKFVDYMFCTFYSNGIEETLKDKNFMKTLPNYYDQCIFLYKGTKQDIWKELQEDYKVE